MIDVNLHSDSFHAHTADFSGSNGGFVTFSVSTPGQGEATFYIRNLQSAETIAQAALDMLRQVQEMEDAK